MRKTIRVTQFTAIIFLTVAFVREDFVLFAWKEAWFLLLPKMDDDHMVTRRNLMEL